ncbi:MAG: hypothetical protein GY851_02185 [bacterium]|nr:hypothetical protein [bacterium]
MSLFDDLYAIQDALTALTRWWTTMPTDLQIKQVLDRYPGPECSLVTAKRWLNAALDKARDRRTAAMNAYFENCPASDDRPRPLS